MSKKERDKGRKWDGVSRVPTDKYKENWEEIFGRQDIGYWWSDDSKSLVFLRTDESPVTKMHYVDFKPQEPRLITQRYPKTGTENPIVKIGVFEVDYPRVKWVKLEPYEYICRIKWLPDSKSFSVFL